MEYITDDPNFQQTTSETFRRRIEMPEGCDDDDREKFEHATLLTHVYDTIGKVFAYEAEELALWQLALYQGSEALPAIISLPDMHEPSYRYYAARQICLIDVPILSVMGGAAKERRMEAEGIEG